MSYTFKNVKGHIEVLDEDGNFVLSADTLDEAFREVRELHNEESAA